MAADKAYLYTERAHYMCPNMHFGIMLRIADTFDLLKMQASLAALTAAHPFLRSLIAEETGTGKLYYAPKENLLPSVIVKETTANWQQDYDEISCAGWNVHQECLLKTIAYPDEQGFSLLLIAHHLLCDGRGLLQLAEEFAQHYKNGVPPQYAEEKLIASLQDLPANSDLPWISKVIIGDANKKWKKEQHKVPYETYLAFEKKYIRENPVQRDLTVVEGEALKEIQDLCHQEKVSVNDYLIAKMMLEENTGKVLIAEDIRSKISCWQQGAIGNYSTAFGVVVKKKAADIAALAKQVRAVVQDITTHPKKEMLVLACYLRMEPDLLDAVAIATLGDFPSASGKFVGSNMFGFAAQAGFSITNLGKIISDTIEDAFFIPPASPANRKIWGVLTVNGKMTICTAAAKKQQP